MVGGVAMCSCCTCTWTKHGMGQSSQPQPTTNIEHHQHDGHNKKGNDRNDRTAPMTRCTIIHLDAEMPGSIVANPVDDRLTPRS